MIVTMIMDVKHMQYLVYIIKKDKYVNNLVLCLQWKLRRFVIEKDF